MNLLHKISVLLLGFLPINLYANSTICILNQDELNLISAKTLVWDQQTKKAKFTDMRGNTYNGAVIATKKHGEHGNKTNLYFNKNYVFSDAVEFMVFPVDENNFRVIGVAYLLKNNRQVLDMSLGNNLAKCEQI
ncbi:hypothetical protein [Acinetobacter sp. YH12106]|uniref:hypothetical protein n=1 Tax=Acinetobacter sp. YH12106 TaxID=2601094 RepID=UPI0015D1E83E|nr:hypothetical protein [Acinetobacter sp. YH12106]